MVVSNRNITVGPQLIRSEGGKCLEGPAQPRVSWSLFSLLSSPLLPPALAHWLLRASWARPPCSLFRPCALAAFFLCAPLCPPQ